MQDFRNLQVWKKSHDLTLLVYRLTIHFPKDEIFGLRTQIIEVEKMLSSFYQTLKRG